MKTKRAIESTNRLVGLLKKKTIAHLDHQEMVKVRVGGEKYADQEDFLLSGVCHKGTDTCSPTTIPPNWFSRLSLGDCCNLLS
jgi:hypothetical protein